MPKFDFGDAIFVVLLLLALFGGGTGEVVTAPFKTDHPITVVVHDPAAVGSLPSWVEGNSPATVEGWCKANKHDFRLLSKDAEVKLLDAKWQAAFAAKGPNTPWIVSAGPKTGFTKILPVSAADTIKLLQGVK